MRPLFTMAAVACVIAQSAFAQTAETTRNTNLRSTPATTLAPIRLLTSGEKLTLLSSTRQAGYYHVTAGKDRGWVWSRNVRVTSQPGAGDIAMIAPATPSAGADLNIAGSANFGGCGDGLWKHVYHPARLLVVRACITVTGVIVDATASQSTHHPDGMRHEGDGDTHGWLKLDPQFKHLLNAGNKSDEEGNLVFEFVCHYKVSQDSAKPACAHFTDHTVLPPIGTHVAVKGSYVQDDNHAKWMEIHPVSSITAK